MDTTSFINKYLSADKNHIKQLSAVSALRSKEELYKLLKWWLMTTKDYRIGNPSLANNTPVILLVVGSSNYYINADTTKEGVRDFLANKNNPWQIVLSNRGNQNVVTNRLDGMKIPGFYMYKSI